jgi:hypothetical protein
VGLSAAACCSCTAAVLTLTPQSPGLPPLLHLQPYQRKCQPASYPHKKAPSWTFCSCCVHSAASAAAAAAHLGVHRVRYT